MKTLEQILQETEAKARQMATEVQSKVDNVLSKTLIKEKLEQADVDDIVRATLEKYLKEEAKKPKNKKRKVNSKSSSLDKPPPKSKPHLRFDMVLVQETYAKTGLQPFKTQYWFYEDLQKHPLIQASVTNEDFTAATPMAAYVLMKRRELLDSENPPRFITDHRDLEKPSNTWTLGRLSQVSGLSLSYIGGFRGGYAGNASPHPGCSKLYHEGFEDGVKIRNEMIALGMIEPDEDFDVYENETNEGVLSELHRVRGYKRKA